MTEVITRSFEIRKVDEEAREVTGIAVPYGVATDVGGYTESFERGAIESHEGVKLCWNHQEVIGKVIRGEDTDEGYEITAHISDTALGRDAYTYLKDGVVDRFSVGFLPVEHRVAEDGAVVRTKVDLKEVSLVPFPAYEGAKISEVRADATNATNQTKEVSNETIMEIENIYDDSELRSELEIVKRELAVVRENGVVTTSEPVSQFRSMGEWGLAAMNGDPRVKEERATVTSTSGHFSNDWRGGLITVVERGRPLVNMFEKNNIANGHKTFEYLEALTGSGAVAVQSSEGATIANLSGSVTTSTGTVSTYAGYIDVSFQTEDWTDVDLVGALVRYAGESYGKVTNDRLRTVLTAATPQTGTSFTLSSATAQDYVKAIVDAGQKVDANAKLARNIDFALVSSDVFLAMAATVDSAGRPVFVVGGNNGVNTIGNVNPLALSLNVAGLPVYFDPALSAKTMYIASSKAVGSWENAGAPIDLRATNITALTKQYALYGYYEAKVKDANGLVKATIA